MPQSLEISRQVRKLVALTVALYLVVAAVVIGAVAYVIHQGAVERRGRTESRLLICRQLELAKGFLRTDKQLQIAKAIAFLKIHPRGAGAISRDLIVQGIGDDRAALTSLRAVDCQAFAHDPTRLVYVKTPRKRDTGSARPRRRSKHDEARTPQPHQRH